MIGEKQLPSSKSCSVLVPKVALKSALPVPKVALYPVPLLELSYILWEVGSE